MFDHAARGTTAVCKKGVTVIHNPKLLADLAHLFSIEASVAESSRETKRLEAIADELFRLSEEAFRRDAKMLRKAL